MNDITGRWAAMIAAPALPRWVRSWPWILAVLAAAALLLATSWVVRDGVRQAEARHAALAARAAALLRCDGLPVGPLRDSCRHDVGGKGYGSAMTAALR